MTAKRTTKKTTKPAATVAERDWEPTTEQQRKAMFDALPDDIKAARIETIRQMQALGYRF